MHHIFGVVLIKLSQQLHTWLILPDDPAYRYNLPNPPFNSTNARVSQTTKNKYRRVQVTLLIGHNPGRHPYGCRQFRKIFYDHITMLHRLAVSTISLIFSPIETLPKLRDDCIGLCREKYARNCAGVGPPRQRVLCGSTLPPWTEYYGLSRQFHW